MDLEQELIGKIAALDDETLRKSIGSVAKNMGFDPNLAALYLTDMDKIREAVKNLKPEDLTRVKENLGEDTVDEIIKNIRSELGL
ncbi:MAG: hypothetical protein IKU24_01350 [Clostridia bacterium]|nr:hypothetical protein [Clostridia bacterium]